MTARRHRPPVCPAQATRAALALALLILFPLAAVAHQPRSQVSRVRGDMRTLATAIESYYVDHGAYPPAAANQFLQPSYLTTPIPYLGPSPFTDSFKIGRDRRMWSHDYLFKSWHCWLVLALMLSCFGFILMVAASPDEKGRQKWNMFVQICIVLLVAAYAIPAIAMVVFRDAKLEGSSVRYTVPNRSWDGDSDLLNYWSDGADWVLQSVGPSGVRDAANLEEFLAHYRAGGIDARTADYFFEPVNGTVSSGDLFRVKQ